MKQANIGSACQRKQYCYIKRKLHVQTQIILRTYYSHAEMHLNHLGYFKGAKIKNITIDLYIKTGTYIVKEMFEYFFTTKCVF